MNSAVIFGGLFFMKKIEKDIDAIKQKILKIGLFRPGTIVSQYNVCGSPGCKCKDKKNPQKHGPYNYLSYTFKKKSFTEFISKNKLASIQKQVNNYNKFKELVEKLIEKNIELSKEEK